MESLSDRLESANRLSVVCERIGYALWQLQELESCTAQFFVLVAQAERGMGEDAGNKLLEKAQRKTFGQTIHAMIDAGVIERDLVLEMKHVLSERNWLVHKSRAESSGAVRSDTQLDETVSRVDQIANVALSVLKKVGCKVEDFVVSQGVSREFIDRESARILAGWHNADAI